MTQRVLTSFFGFGVYFPLLGLFISAVVALYLLLFIRNQEKSRISQILIFLLVISTVVWAFSILAFFLKLSFSSMPLIGLSGMLMMTVWLATPLVSTAPYIRWGSLFLLMAAVSLGIPAAAGLSAVRVYNYPLIFFFAFLAWSAFVALSHVSERASRTALFLTSALFIVLTLMAVWVMGHSLIAFRANYAPGVVDLERQESLCPHEICPALDPLLPYQTALSGYGEHDYASTDAVLEWLEK